MVELSRLKRKFNYIVSILLLTFQCYYGTFAFFWLTGLNDRGVELVASMQSDLLETTASCRALAKLASDAFETRGFPRLTVCIAIGNLILGEKISFRIIAVYFFLIAIFWETNGEALGSVIFASIFFF